MFVSRLALLVLLLAGRTALGVEPHGERVNKDFVTFANGNNDFTFDLYHQLQSQPGSLFLSPYGVSTALMLAFGGAEGETKDQIGKVLHLSLDPIQVHPVLHGLDLSLTRFAPTSRVQMKLATRLWGQSGIQFQQPFSTLARDYYGAEPETLDFSQADAARAKINAWTTEKTDDKIHDLVPAEGLDPQTRLVLTNAIYFKGGFRRPFDAANTTKQPFRVSAKRKVKTPMMQKVESCFYGESGGWQAIELRLAYREYLSMFVLLPQKAGSLAKLEKGLDTKVLNELFARMEVRRVDIELPKFKIASSANLKQPLESLGMPLAFSDQADFSAIGGNEKPHLDAVYHKTVADVSEMGIESAADTEPMHISDESLEVNAAFHANQPFLFLIRDNYSSTLLFIGRVTDPTAGEKE